MVNCQSIWKVFFPFELEDRSSRSIVGSLERAGGGFFIFYRRVSISILPRAPNTNLVILVV